MRPRISIIVLCLNKLAYTRRCVQALRAHTDLAYHQLVIVDNGSTDDTPAYLTQLATELPELVVCRHEANLGFGGGNNAGAALAQGTYLLLLNNDTEVQEGWLQPLIDLAESETDIGAVGARLIYPDGRLQEAGGLIFADGSGWNYGRYDPPDDPEYLYVREPDYCSAAALLVRTALFRELGGFDRAYDPAYYEDVDLCFAIRRAGYRVLYQPHARVVHHEGVTGGTDGAVSGAKRYQAANAQTFKAKWHHQLMLQPDPPPDVRAVRLVSDRRCRGRAQVLVVLDQLPEIHHQRVYDLIDDLLAAQYHVTIALRVMEGHPAVAEAIERLQLAGALVFVLNNRAAAPNSALREVLERRRYDAALLWSIHTRRWATDQIHRFSPHTQVLGSVDPHTQLLIFSPLTAVVWPAATHANLDTLPGAYPRITPDPITPTLLTASEFATRITIGQGFHRPEGSWRWMSGTGYLHIWAEATTSPVVISFDMMCSLADHYMLFPFAVRVYIHGSRVIELTFSESYQVCSVRLPLPAASGDVSVRLESEARFVPSQLGIGTDKRTLSVRVSAPRLQPAQLPGT
jgi:GT2 family glycosyltransferase